MDATDPVFAFIPDGITESELLQLQVGDIFYENDCGCCIKFEMTKHAERGGNDLGWSFSGKILEVNSKETPDEGTEVDFFISDGAGFAYTCVTLKEKYYEI